MVEKSADAFRTISEVAEDLKVPQHVLRFWETRFPQIKPMKRAGGRRYYRPDDVALLRAIRSLLYGEGYTIRGVQKVLKEQGPRAVTQLAQDKGVAAVGGGGGEDVVATAENVGPDDGREVSRLTKADLHRLQAALFELGECERVLTEARA